MKSKLGGEATSPRDNQGMAENKIITRVLASVQQLDAQTWNVLLASQSTPTPFMRHEYLAAMEQSGSATPDTGWIARVITVWDGDELLAACPLYIKTHSYGEYFKLCRLASIDQMTPSEEDGHEKSTGERGVKHHVSLCC